MLKLIFELLEDTRSIRRYLLAFEEGPSGLLVKIVADGVTPEGSSGSFTKIVTDGVVMMLF